MTTKGTPTTSKGIAFAHLLNDPSPRSSANTGSVSGLRRWASCGVEFPASASKKRRTLGAFRAHRDGTDDIFNIPSSDNTFRELPPKSKLAGMFEQMRESVAPHNLVASSELPSSSSPLPDSLTELLESDSLTGTYPTNSTRTFPLSLLIIPLPLSLSVLFAFSRTGSGISSLFGLQLHHTHSLSSITYDTIHSKATKQSCDR